MKSFAVKMAVTAAAAAFLFMFVIGIYLCTANSMYPRVLDGDLLITSRISGISSGDVIVFSRDGKHMCSRVAAVPGDRISVSEAGTVTVNGMPVSEEVFYPTDPGDADYPAELGEGEYFVLSDYRISTGTDSRSSSVGIVTSRDIEGKVIFLVRRRGF
ncbi:MAG: signal peptidase I [Lachnospiraceae bacterium]|nr:signal peptidase I [Lachnospiraceae bacterium]